MNQKLCLIKYTYTDPAKNFSRVLTEEELAAQFHTLYILYKKYESPFFHLTLNLGLMSIEIQQGVGDYNDYQS